MTPALSYLIPLYLLFRALGRLGTLVPLILTNLVLTVPMVIWVLLGFFEGLPIALEEAALVDGANLWQAFRLVALPLARPGIIVALTLSFILTWNNFIFGVVLGSRRLLKNLDAESAGGDFRASKRRKSPSDGRQRGFCSRFNPP